MPAVFITGTGTGVGKTFVATGLIRRFRELRQPVDALKPVVSGFDPLLPSGSDPALLIEALGLGNPRTPGTSPRRSRAPFAGHGRAGRKSD